MAIRQSTSTCFARSVQGGCLNKYGKKKSLGGDAEKDALSQN